MFKLSANFKRPMAWRSEYEVRQREKTFPKSLARPRVTPATWNRRRPMQQAKGNIYAIFHLIASHLALPHLVSSHLISPCTAPCVDSRVPWIRGGRWMMMWRMLSPCMHPPAGSSRLKGAPNHPIISRRRPPSPSISRVSREPQDGDKNNVDAAAGRDEREEREQESKTLFALQSSPFVRPQPPRAS